MQRFMTIPKIICVGLWLTAALCIQKPSSAQEDEVSIGSFFGVGARAMGMGSAFMAIADDYSALHWNPAGLAQIHRIEIYSSLSHERFRNKVSYAGRNMTDSQSKTHFSSFGLSYPVPTERGSLVVGLGYHRTNSFDGLMTMSGKRTPVEYVDA